MRDLIRDVNGSSIRLEGNDVLNLNSGYSHLERLMVELRDLEGLHHLLRGLCEAV